MEDYEGRIKFKHPLFDFMFVHHLFLDNNDPLKEKLDDVVKTFDYLIDFLRTDFPNKHVNNICGLLWRLIGNQVILVAQIPDSPLSVLGFMVIGNAQAKQGIVYIPDDWLDQVKKSRSMGLGGIVMAASQARDFFNEKITFDEKGIQESRKRANMYEAEMLLTLQEHESFVPNDYQNHIIKQHPNGIDSSYLYEGKVFQDQS